MTIEAKIAPPNSLLLVMGEASGEMPDSMNGQLIVVTSSCIAIGTLCEVDGETSVTLSDDRLRIQGIENLKRVFSGILATPRNFVEVCTVLLEPILTLPVRNDRSGVEIWANSKMEPDRLYVLIL